MAMNTPAGHAALTSLAAATGEPAWLTQYRQQALEAGNNQDMPAWDRTNAADFPLQFPPAPVQTNALVESYHQDGAVCTDIFAALCTHNDLVRRHLGSQVPLAENKLTALHYAYLNSGTFVYVPRNVELKVPVSIRRVIPGGSQGTHTHTLIVAEQGAQVTVVETDADAGENEALHTHIVEIAVGAGASVQYTAVQSLSTKSSHFALRRCSLANDANVEWVLGAVGAARSKDTTETLLQGNGCQANSLMLCFSQQTQHLDNEMLMTHTGLHTSSDILARGVAGGESRAVYRALTHIARGARTTSAYQRANTLLLTKSARADAIPALTIDEDDVQAGHAATVGQVDADQLFYLMSRGLSPVNAIRMIVAGFFDPIMQRIPLDDVRNDLQQLIDRKMTL